jgi:undecaprenyl-diphosphatase
MIKQHGVKTYLLVMISLVFFLTMTVSIPHAWGDVPVSRDRNLVNPFDRQVMFPYSEPLSLASDITQYISILSPALFAFAAPASDWLEISALYATSALLSYGTRTLMKMSIERYRPYTYAIDSYPSDPSELIEEERESFPSGHTIMAFTGAAFTQTLFSLRYPDSPYRTAGTIAAWSLAGATAVLRVASGNHFITDVLAGAAIGSLFGFAVPYLAWKFLPSWKSEHVSVMVGPSSALVQLQL